MEHGIRTFTAEALAAAHVIAINNGAEAVKAMIEREWVRRSRLKLPERILHARAS